SVFNAARIWKVYGTMACKGDNLPERPHRLSRLLAVPASIHHVPLSLLAPLAARLPTPEPAPRRGGSPREPFDLTQWITRHGLPVVSEAPWGQGGYRWRLNPCPWNDDHTNSSAYIVQLSSGAIAAGCHHNGCSGNTWAVLRSAYEPGWQPYTQPATLHRNGTS